MRKTVVSVAAVALMVPSARAADMLLKAPVLKAPTPAFDWTGVYVGGNVGYSVARDHSTETLTFPNGTQFSGEPFTLAPGGAVGGGQIGANWQSGHLLLGLEGDWQWADEKDSVCIQSCSANVGGLNESLNVGQRLSRLATLRGRIGYADGTFLWYVTGGGAWGHVDNMLTAGHGPSAIGATFGHSLHGWTAGGGVETALSEHWSTKLEYLYADLGSTSDAFTSFFNNTQVVQTSVRDHIVRLGVNYRFGGGGAYASAGPVAASAVVSHDWTGFYLGGNAGHAVGRDKGSEVLTLPPAGSVFTAQTFTHAPAGWPVGVQAGYNWQRGNWVAGLEADWQWTHQHDVISITMGTPPSNLNQIGLTLDQRLRWLSTLRGRLGYERDGWFWYMTGGAAWGSVVETDALTLNIPTSTTATARFSHDRLGWTFGVGVEKALVGHWSAKVEYLYADLGATTDSFAIVPGAIETVHQNVIDHIVRLGVNYRFGQPAP